MAEPTLSKGAIDTRAVLGPAQTLAITPTENHPFRTRSESVVRGAGCRNSARPVLRGAGEGNLPGLPDPFQSDEKGRRREVDGCWLPLGGPIMAWELAETNLLVWKLRGND